MNKTEELMKNLENSVEDLLWDCPDFVKSYIKLYILGVFTDDKVSEVEYMGVKICIPRKCYESLQTRKDVAPETFMGFVFSHISASVIRRIFEKITSPQFGSLLESFEIPEGYLEN